MAHEKKSCTRCNGTFECKIGNITQCHCYDVRMSDKERDYIFVNYNDCLCGKCLGYIKYEIRYKSIKAKMLSILSIFKK